LRRGLASGLDAELGQDGGDVMVDRLGGEENALCDLSVGMAVRHQLEESRATISAAINLKTERSR